MARRAGVDESVLDEVRLAVGEACSRAVGLQQRGGLNGAVRVALTDQEKRFLVEVGDGAGSLSELAASDPAAESADGSDDRLGLAVITGLVEDLEVSRDDDGGLIRMSWPVTT